LTLKAVAEASKRSVSSISDIEHSRRAPLKPEEIVAFCEALNVTGEIDGLLSAACHAEGTYKIEVESPLEKDLYVTLKRSIDSRLIGDEDIRTLIKGLKQKLEARENQDKKGDSKMNGVN